MSNSISKRMTLQYTDPLALMKLNDYMTSHVSIHAQEWLVLCIGTDRSTGDSLGPLTGTFLSKLRPRTLKVVGTLHDPVHAMNLEDTLSSIGRTYSNPSIIAIDASLGKNSSIGNIICGTGPLQPGAAFNKDLPEVGDFFLTGIINMKGLFDFSVLQSTRLSLIYDMAHVLARSLYRLDMHLSSEKKQESS